MENKEYNAASAQSFQDNLAFLTLVELFSLCIPKCQRTLFDFEFDAKLHI